METQCFPSICWLKELAPSTVSNWLFRWVSIHISLVVLAEANRISFTWEWIRVLLAVKLCLDERRKPWDPCLTALNSWSEFVSAGRRKESRNGYRSLEQCNIHVYSSKSCLWNVTQMNIVFCDVIGPPSSMSEMLEQSLTVVSLCDILKFLSCVYFKTLCKWCGIQDGLKVQKLTSDYTFLD